MASSKTKKVPFERAQPLLERLVTRSDDLLFKAIIDVVEQIVPKEVEQAVAWLSDRVDGWSPLERVVPTEAHPAVWHLAGALRLESLTLLHSKLSAGILKQLLDHFNPRELIFVSSLVDESRARVIATAGQSIETLEISLPRAAPRSSSAASGSPESRRCGGRSAPSVTLTSAPCFHGLREAKHSPSSCSRA